MSAESRFQTVKTFGTGLAVLFALLVLPLLYIYGVVWFSEKTLPWLFLACVIAYAICLLVLLPLSIFRKLRPWVGLGLFFASFLFGTMLFAFSCLVVLQAGGTNNPAIPYAEGEEFESPRTRHFYWENYNPSTVDVCGLTLGSLFRRKHLVLPAAACTQFSA